MLAKDLKKLLEELEENEKDLLNNTQTTLFDTEQSIAIKHRIEELQKEKKSLELEVKRIVTDNN